MSELGRLVTVNPRDVWPGEATHFTPWLLEHADHLAEALGIDLQLERAEHPVGGFSLDLIGVDETNDAVLIVENQLEPTDHTHLGQLLTYAAGTGAATIVWIATRFREEHRQALDWLNEASDEHTHFFGIELKVVRIGDSLPAPLLEVVAQPNDWQKQVRAGAQAPALTTKRVQYREFWALYLERLHAEHPEWSRARKPGTSNWMVHPSPIRGTEITPSFASNGRLRHELYIDCRDGDRNSALLEAFRARQDELEAAYGRSLEFEALPRARACRIADYSTGDVANADDHQRYIDWFFDAGTRLRRALAAVPLSFDDVGPDTGDDDAAEGG